MSEESTETTTIEGGDELTTALLSDATNTDQPAEGGLPPGEAWGTTPEPQNPQDPPNTEPTQQPKPDFNPSSLTPEQITAIYEHASQIPDGAKLFPDKPQQIDQWDKFREAHQQLKDELAQLKEAGPGTEELTKLRQQYEAVDRIRNSDAYAADVMAPQSAALAKAKAIAEKAAIDEKDIEGLFRVDDEYSAEQQLMSLGDQAAQNLLRPLVMTALEARQKGQEALKADDPIATLKEWESRSAQLREQQGQQMVQHETQLDGQALTEAWESKIANTPIGKTEIAQNAVKKIADEIRNGTPVDRTTIYEALIQRELSPVKDQQLVNQARRIQELEQALARVSGGNDIANPAPRPQSPNGVTPRGGLPAGTAWGGN